MLEREEYPQGYTRKVSRDREDLPNMDEQQQRDLVQRLNRIEGQVRGIKKMLDEQPTVPLAKLPFQKRAAALYAQLYATGSVDVEFDEDG